MGYQNGRNILPPSLLAAVQQYVDGTTLYIPRKPERRRPWGASQPGKNGLDARNRAIRERYAAGTPAKQLAREHFLSVKTIYAIIERRRR